MKKTGLDYSDITEELCKACGECCKVQLPIAIDQRYYDYLIALGFKILIDFGDMKSGLIDLGYCKHLEINDGKFSCMIYNERPKLCRDYTCVAWAKYSDIEQKSHNLKHALKIYKKLKSNQI